MKVIVSVVGRFHAFDLAYQLQKKNSLHKLVTTYPSFIVSRWNIKSSLVVSEVFLELLNRSRKRLPFINSQVISNYVKKKHSQKASKIGNDVDVFIGWSGSSLDALIELKNKSVVTILERGSCHYTTQMNILNNEFSNQNQKFYPDYNSWQVELLEYEMADYISIPSTFVKETFIQNGVPENKLIVNPYGVNLNQFTKICKNDNVFRIIYAGAGSIQKGFHYLLQAFYELNLPNIEMWHLGEIKNEVIPFINRYQNENIKFLGHIPQDELFKYYSQGSVFVLPSLQDGWGMVLLQAMACELPIICTKNTAGNDLITNNGEEGFVIPICDVDAIKDKIRYLYHNQHILNAMGRKARFKVSAGYTWDDYGNRYFNNLERILNEY